MARRTRSTTKSAWPASASESTISWRVSGVEVLRDLDVEVGGQPVADVGLDQPLEPVAGRGRGVEDVEGLHERRHRLDRVGAQGRDPLEQRLDVAELDRRHLAERELVGQLHGELGVVGQPLERGDLAVGDRPEQVDHGGPVGGVLEGDRILLGPVALPGAAVRRGEGSVMAAAYR